MKNETVIEINDLKKQYKLGQIGGGTLTRDLQTWWALKRGKEDPNSMLGTNARSRGSVFMALNGVSLKVYKGDTLGIIGGNGAGKSTLLKILSEITSPTEGEIKVKGRISSMLEVGTGFNRDMTGRENIYMNGAILGMTRAEVDRKIDDIIAFSECAEFIDTPVKRYSSGMFVKLAFAVAAHLDSEILVMDEVLAVGDMKFQEKCLGKMGDVATNGGRTVLYVSHNMSTIRQLCNRCVVLKEGKVIFDGDVEKAISVYMDNQVEFKSTYNLDDISRPSPQHGSQLRMTELSFTDNKRCYYYDEKFMRFSIKWKSNIDANDIYLRWELKYIDDTPIAMAESLGMGSIKSGQCRHTEFKIDISNLPTGNYGFTIDLYEKNTSGIHQSYDSPRITIPFEVVEAPSSKLVWQHKWWGHIRMPDMEIEDING